MDQRSRLLFLSAVFLPLASGIGAIFLVVWIIQQVSPGLLAARPESALEILIGTAILLVSLLSGFLIGTLVLVAVWRPFVSRPVLEGIVTKPDVPIISRFLAWVFDQIYPVER